MDGNLINAINSVTGAVSKGLLMIEKPNPNRIEQAGPARQPVAPSYSVAGAKNFYDVAKATGAGAGTKALAGLNVAANALKSVGLNGLALSPDAANYYKMQVQYNPNTITISGRNGTVFGRGVTDASDGVYNQYEYSMKTTFRVDLMFDDTNLNDAFCFFEPPTTIEGAYNTGKSVVTNLIEKEYSVRKYVEALIGALMNVDAKHVIFAWGSQQFKGILTEVSPTYTMFNKKGEPIRAKVTLNILQTGTDSDPDYWALAYKKMGFS